VDLYVHSPHRSSRRTAEVVKHRDVYFSYRFSCAGSNTSVLIFGFIRCNDICVLYKVWRPSMAAFLAATQYGHVNLLQNFKKKP
jgi:hypothetical protein